jgi:peptidoglycan hydrolase-like protein with peptidoglycan-binding domain
LQRSLNTLIGADLTVDGIYGPNTKDAVRRFQKANGLQVDGVAGPITRAKVKELLDAR